ncbi:helix-turn-helix domain-containing protein [Sciscionella marina]|uniref:helix-turn-helix domain-containing protein n=1 Tax=Sciscionella marina TaxID=508770 RepID=UPI000373DACB|nr:helix-turn-helix transcriptional regulator [Sciscionella marina]
MTENWAAVAKAINDRLAELGMRQRELAERSQVSQAIVRELQRNTRNRQRSARTLEALSTALEWHPDHLAAVLAGRTPLRPHDTGEPGIDEIRDRLGAIEDSLTTITKQLAEMNANLAAQARPVSRPSKR